MKERLGALVLLLVFVGAIWLVHIVNSVLLDRSLNQYGLSPLALPYRGLSNLDLSASYAAVSLRGILLSPDTARQLLAPAVQYAAVAGARRLRRAAWHEDAHRRVAGRGLAGRIDGLAGGASGGSCGRERAGVRLLRLPGGAGLVRAQRPVNRCRVCGAAAIRRNHLRGASAGWVRLVGGAPVWLDCGRAGGAMESGW